ncbi:hypothetical protein ACTTAL_17445 [Rhodobacter capsulatus]|uniref:hypothetical protein n=1 Tax=Rhodobacter capsulatus TaxID=1061 RepID=UPI00373FC6CD
MHPRRCALKRNTSECRRATQGRIRQGRLHACRHHRRDVFIPPHMITAEGIQAGDLVEGWAVASFDQKRGKWGMKAIQAKPVARQHVGFGNRAEADDPNREQKCLPG